MKPDKNIITHYGGRIRIRSCGLLIEQDSVLLVRHEGLGETGTLWAPPGGGLDFGRTVEQQLVLEFKEETGLDIAVGEHLFTFEFLSPPLHSIELFFVVHKVSGTLLRGFDPEHKSTEQIIKEVHFVTFADLRIMPIKSLHHLFTLCTHPEDLLKMRGYFKFEE